MSRRRRSATHRHVFLRRARPVALVACLATGGWYGLVATSPASAAPTPLHGVVTLAPARSVVGQTIAATLSGSHVPPASRVAGIALNWGDGSKPVHVASLARRVVHQYLRPGHFRVTATVTVRRAAGGPVVSTHAAAVEVVTAPEGSYTGADRNYPYVDPVRFYVSRTGASMNDILIPGVNMTCTPGGGHYAEPLTIPAAAIRPTGSFSGHAVLHGVVHESGGNYAATYHMSFRGSFDGLSSGAPQAAGTFEETMTFHDAAARSCTSGPQPFGAARDAQPVQTAARPAVGSYTGADPLYSYVDPVTFYVTAAGTELRNILVPSVPVYCVPGTDSLGGLVTIPSAKVSASGAFVARGVQHGTYKGFPATFGYVLSGDFHGLDKTGTPQASGTFVETVTFSDSARRACTSGVQPWAALRDTQPPQSPAIRSGSYTGANPEYGYVDPVTFSVANGRLQNIAIPQVPMTCMPGGSPAGSSLTIPSVSIARDGTFSGTASAQDVYNGRPARLTYSFSGSFESLNKASVPRVSGTYLETLSYSNGTSYTCTSNDQPWSATLKTG